MMCKCGHNESEHWGKEINGVIEKRDGDCLHWEDKKGYCNCSKFEKLQEQK